jgi:hypothetical protein
LIFGGFVCLPCLECSKWSKTLCTWHAPTNNANNSVPTPLVCSCPTFIFVLHPNPTYGVSYVSLGTTYKYKLNSNFLQGRLAPINNLCTPGFSHLQWLLQKMVIIRQYTTICCHFRGVLKLLIPWERIHNIWKALLVFWGSYKLVSGLTSIASNLLCSKYSSMYPLPTQYMFPQ